MLPKVVTILAVLLAGTIAQAAAAQPGPSLAIPAYTAEPAVWVLFAYDPVRQIGPFYFVSVTDAGGGEGVAMYAVTQYEAARARRLGRDRAPSVLVGTYDAATNLWAFSWGAVSGSSPFFSVMPFSTAGAAGRTP